MSNEQGDVAIVTKLSDGIKQGIAARVVEQVSDLHTLWVQLITELEQLERLTGAGGTRTQHSVDHDALLAEIVADLLGITFTIWSKASLAVPAARPRVFSLRVPEYEQDATLVHSRSLRRRLGRYHDVTNDRGVDAMFKVQIGTEIQRLQPGCGHVLQQSLSFQTNRVP